MLAAEVLVEETKRLTGPIDDLLDREIPARLTLIHQFEGGIEKSLKSTLRPRPRRVERPGHCSFAATHARVVLRRFGLGSRFVLRHRADPASGLVSIGEHCKSP